MNNLGFEDYEIYKGTNRSVPQDWSIANVVPIFKKGTKTELGNYRPVSLTSTVGKILEGILRDAMLEYLKRNNLMTQDQHGFTRDRSCQTNLISFYEECHYPVPRVSVSLSCTPSVSVIILYPECQCHYPVPPVSVSLSCTPSVSVIILYPECQCHYPVPRVSVSLSCTPSVSVIILYPEYRGSSVIGLGVK
ncbi:unnamed protein product [Ranitomeya imitator]|uniref:Reverse transcriptase domain-containing protein n=1 Tax=Ranitomeya imitator TaxID=111125 RepID=A0ABN9LGY9_9NEOB|nr:unnamed protein product [Ranitomeya imitator]